MMSRKTSKDADEFGKTRQLHLRIVTVSMVFVWYGLTRVTFLDYS